MGSKDPRDITPPKKGDKAPDTPNHDAQAREEADIQSTNAPSVHHLSEKEQEQPAAQKKRQKAWLHCRRFYLWYLLGVIIFLIIFLPLLFKVIIPAIIQAVIAKQGIPLVTGEANTTSAEHVLLSVGTTINTPLGATLDPFTLLLYDEKTKPFTPFFNLSIPKIHANKETDIQINAETMTVLNETELVSWANGLVDQDERLIWIRGDPKVHFGALSATPRVDRSVTVPGLKGLQGFGLKDVSLILPPDKDGRNVVGSATVPNWGSLNINVGNVSLNVFTGDVRIGLVTLYDVSLAPGNNTVYLNGTVDINHVIQNLGPILNSQAASLSKGLIEVNVTGNATFMNGQRVTYVEDILKGRKLTASLSITKLLSVLVNGLVGHGSDGDLVRVVGDLFGNESFIDHVAGHWNITKNASTKGTGLRAFSPW
ncbi:hypothetical protein MAJ_09506, partial [Metarhizium majus ARSEF 297]